MAQGIPARDEMDAQYQWAIEDLYASDALWYADFELAKTYPAKISALKGTLAQSADALLAMFSLDDELSVLIDRLANYAHRRADEDTKVAAYQEMKGKLSAFFVDIQNASAYQLPEMIALSDEQLAAFYAQTPALELYRTAIDRIMRRKEHVLPEEQEALLALAGEVRGAPEEIYSMFNDADLEFPAITSKDGEAVPVTHASFIPLMQSTDRAIRIAAFGSVYGTYENFRNTAAALLSSQVKQLVFSAKARKYASTLDAALDGTDVPDNVYRSLIDAVHQNIDALHRYAALRKKALGLEALHMYDLYTPIVKKADTHIPYERAAELICDALLPLGADYQAILREGFANRWVDVYENANKMSGAYSAGARVHPFVLMNYKGTIDSVFTLAHEMGHAIHSYLSNRTQPVVYSNYVIFVAEVASTCNEALLMEHMLKITDDRDERAYLINYFLEQFRTTLYRQTMFAEFELKINEAVESGEVLTADSLCAMYRALNEFYYGDGVVIDPEIDMEWARIPHFYYNYYVYQYATGYSAAIALSRRILSGGEPAVKDYLGFLSAGCSTDPISILKNAGCDLSSPAPVTAALALFDDLITELDGLL
ncbi:MAG: oligoendopeptidase F [Oscillospiraceae bacterium]